MNMMNMKKTFLAAGLLVFASTSQANQFTSVYSMVLKSLRGVGAEAKLTTKEITMEMGKAGRAVVQAPVHKFSLPNGINVTLVDISRLGARELRHEGRIRGLRGDVDDVSLQISIPLKTLPRNADQYSAGIKAQLKAIDEELNTVDGLVPTGPKGIASYLADDNSISISSMADAGQLDEVLKDVLAKLSEIKLTP